MKHESDLAAQSTDNSSRKLWVTITILLFIVALLLFGYGPGGHKSEASSKMTVKVVDNPVHLKRISILEQENNLIGGLRGKIKKLEYKLSKEGKKKVEAPPLQQNFGPDDETEEMAGLRARSTLFDEIKPEVIEKVVEKKVDKLIDNPKHLELIAKLEKENKVLAKLRKKLKKLEKAKPKVVKKVVDNPKNKKLIEKLKKENKQLASLRKKIKELEKSKTKVVKKTVDNPKNKKLIEKLKKENKQLAGLRKKIKELEKSKTKIVKKTVDNPKNKKLIEKLKKENKQLAGLRKKIKELEKAKPKVVKKTIDNPKNIKLIEKLKEENKLIVSLKAQIKTLESAKPKVVKEVVKQWVGNGTGYGYGIDPKRLIELEKENRNLVSLLARIKVLEGIHPKVVEKQVGNPELLKRIAVLETENNKMSDLLVRIKRLEKSKPKVIEKLVGKKDLLKKIAVLEKENKLIFDLKKKIKNLEKCETVIVSKAKKVIGQVDKNFRIKTKTVNVSKEKVVLEDDLLADLLTRVTKLESTYSIKADTNITLEADSKLIIELREKLTKQEEELKILRRNLKIGFADTRILFASGSYIVTRKNSKKLTPVIEYLKENKKAKLVLSGFHDKSGLLIANQLLARQRAQVVKAIFVNAGISTDRITVSQPAEAVGMGTPAEARRVEVKVFN